MKPLLLPPLLSALLLPAALPLTCSQDLFAASALRFTAIPDENTARLKERFDKVAAYLSEKTGVDVEYVPVKSYAASVAAFKNDEVQLAWFGGLSGVKARRSVPGSVAIAQGDGRAAGKPMAAFVHDIVGLLHASMAMFNAWMAREGVLVLGGTGPVDANHRRPWIDWIHTMKDQGAMIRNFVKYF